MDDYDDATYLLARKCTMDLDDSLAEISVELELCILWPARMLNVIASKYHKCDC
jgi:hypothetical protein